LKKTINAFGDIDNPCSKSYISDLLHYVVVTKKFRDLPFYFENPAEELVEADVGVDLVLETIKTILTKEKWDIATLKREGLLPLKFSPLKLYCEDYHGDDLEGELKDTIERYGFSVQDIL